MALLIVGIPAGALAVKIRSDHAAESAARHKAAIKADAQAVAADQKTAAAERRRASKEAADKADRRERRSVVKQMQASITKDAKEDVDSGTLDGPIYYSSCDPLGGGSQDDLTALTTTYECVAVNEKLKGGNVRGYVYSATANWNEGSYSWRLAS